MTKNLSNIDQTRRVIQDLKEDRNKWKRVHKQLSKIPNIDVQLYNVGEEVTKLDAIIDTLETHLKDMGGK